MPLQKQFAEIVFNGGLNTKVADELAPSGTLVDAQNLRFRKQGRLEKRNWYDETNYGTFSTGTSTEPIEAVFANQGKAVAMSRTVGCGKLHSGSTTLSLPGDIFAPNKPMAARVSRFVAATTQEATNEAGIVATAACTINGQTVTAHTIIQTTTTAILVVRVFDSSTNELLAMTTQAITPLVTGISQVQVCPIASQNGVVIAWTDGGAPPFSIKGMKYTTSTKTFGLPATIVNADCNSFYFSICDSLTTVVSGGGFYLAYYRNAGAMRVYRLQYSNLTTVLATHNATHASNYGCSICDDGTNGAFIASADATNAYVESFGTPASVSTLVTTSNAIAGVSIAPCTDGGVASVCVAVNQVATPAGTLVGTVEGSFVTAYWATCVAAPVVSASTKIVTGCRAVSHGCTIDTMACFAVAALGGSYTTNTSINRSGASCLLIRLQSTGGQRQVDVIARFGHDRTTLGTSALSNISALTMDSSRVVTTSFIADTSKANIINAVSYAQTAFVGKIQLANSSLPLSYAEINGTTLVAGGELFDFDGMWPIETQPRARPTMCVDTSNAGTSTVATGVSICAVYTYVDQQGRLHRSPPSAAVALSPGASTTNKAFKVYVNEPPAPAYSGFAAGSGSTYTQGIGCELYVTADGGSTYYLALNSSGRKHLYDYSTANTPFFVFTDVRIATASQSPEVYSTGGSGSELWSEPPPSFISVTRIGDRVWGVDAEDRSRVWFSKPLVAGYAVEWNTANTLFVNDRAVAVEDVNGQPCIFAENGIWVVSGDGPNANGAGYFAPAQRLPHNVEVICPTSVCRTPAGVAFRERRGVSMLAGFDLAPIGAPINNKLAVATSSSLVRLHYDHHWDELRVIDSSDDEVFVYNVLEQKWTNWTQDTSYQYVSDAVFASGRTYYAAKTSSRWQLRRELGSDESNFNVSREPVTYKTAIVNLDKVAGYGRLWRLTLRARVPYTNPENGALYAYVYGDETGNEIANASFADMSLLGVSGGQMATIVLAQKQQQVTSIQIELSILSNGPWGGTVDGSLLDYAGGYVVSALLEYGVEPNGRRRVDQRAHKSG